MGTRAVRPYRICRRSARGPPGREKHLEGMQELSQGLSQSDTPGPWPTTIRTLKAVQEMHTAASVRPDAVTFGVVCGGGRDTIRFVSPGQDSESEIRNTCYS
jgi:hypothetical protein